MASAKPGAIQSATEKSGCFSATWEGYMKRIKCFLIAMFCCTLTFAADSKKSSKVTKPLPVAVVAEPPSPPTPPPPPPPTRLGLGNSIEVHGLSVLLTKIIAPATPESVSIGGYTEYAVKLANRLPDREIIISDISILVGDDRRPIVRNPAEILNERNVSLAEQEAITTAAVHAASLIGSFFGIGGMVASSVGVSAAAGHMHYDKPKERMEELAKRGFKKAMVNGGLSLFPGEDLAGSVWFNQRSTEVPSDVIIYLKIGDSAKMVKVPLDFPSHTEAEKSVKSDRPEVPMRSPDMAM
jgi:hypothetical protein